jgi:glycine/D-amino acid oxidase-like deaminating enzyme
MQLAAIRSTTQPSSPVAQTRGLYTATITRRPSYQASPPRVGASRRVRTHADKLSRWGYDVDIRSAADVNTSIEPTVKFDSPNQLVVVFPQESWIGGPLLIRRLLADATLHGARIVVGKAVTNIQAKNDCVTRVSLQDNTSYDIDVIVNGAGPWSARVASLVGRILPMLSSPGLIVRLRSRKFRTTCAMHSPKVEIRPDGDCQILLHSPEIDSRLDASGFADNRLVGDLCELPLGTQIPLHASESGLAVSPQASPNTLPTT